MRGRQRRPLGERDWQAVGDAPIGEPKRCAFAIHRDRWKQARDRGAGAHNVAQARTAALPGREIARPPGSSIVTHDADGSNTMMKAFEAGALELRKPRWNDPALICQDSIELMTESNVQAVRNQMSAAKSS